MRHAVAPCPPRPGDRPAGGSFDPPHAGHLHISREALKRFGLDRLWWLVSPGNPLKPHGPAPLPDRLTAARALVDHPRIAITDFEARAGTRHTAQTLDALRQAAPGLRFVWLMGADNLAQFHRWQDWRRIIESVPVGVLARPGQRISARMSPPRGSTAMRDCPPMRAIFWAGFRRRPGVSSTCRWWISRQAPCARRAGARIPRDRLRGWKLICRDVKADCAAPPAVNSSRMTRDFSRRFFLGTALSALAGGAWPARPRCRCARSRGPRAVPRVAPPVRRR